MSAVLNRFICCIKTVILRYNYSRDDEEIYKEFLEIANELIPHIIKIESSGHSARSIIKDAMCFAHLLRFYDGICQWEEGSATPVLHIGWAKPLVTTISKFDSDVRAQVEIVSEDAVKIKKPIVKKEANGNQFLNNNNNNYCLPSEENTNDQELIKEIESKVSGEQSTSTSHLHPSIEALTAACSEKILNPEYLLQGGGSPFVGGDLEVKNGNGIHPGSSKQVEVKPKVEDTCEPEEKIGRPIVYLRSQKMRGLKDLLLAEKLNTQAIQLQLTAQSQVQVGKKGRGDSDGVGIRPKRTRRE